MAQQINTGEEAKAVPKVEYKVPITEVSENHRRIPKAVFVEDVEAWVEQYGEDVIFEEMNTLYQKYKFMEGQMIRAREGLKVKCPEIKKTLESVALLYTRHQGEEKEVET
jgi:hypothetical protein